MDNWWRSPMVDCGFDDGRVPPDVAVWLARS